MGLVSSQKAAFTLAEVLITLGIIGIVAAMTIPTLIANYQEKQTISKLQKANSILSNMTMMLHSDGVYNSLSGVVNADKSEAFYKNYVLKYFKSPQVSPDEVCAYPDSDVNCYIYKYASGSNSLYSGAVHTKYSASRVFFTTADGISYWFLNMHWVSNDDDSGESHAEYTANPEIFVDLNGIAGPNTFGKDVFRFRADFGNGVVKAQCADYTMDQINEDCSTSGAGYCCAEKIRRDGWKITDDYPF